MSEGSVGDRAVGHVGHRRLDGGTWAVDNNVWLVGDERQVIVVDAAHDAEAIAAAVGDRRVLGLMCTHAHDDHVSAAPELSRTLAAPVLVLVHPDEHVLRGSSEIRSKRLMIGVEQRLVRAAGVAGVDDLCLHGVTAEGFRSGFPDGVFAGRRPR